MVGTDHDLLANVREGPHEAPGNLIRRLCGVQFALQEIMVSNRFFWRPDALGLAGAHQVNDLKMIKLCKAISPLNLYKYLSKFYSI